MARLTTYVNSILTGIIGSVVLCNRNGTPYIRSRPRKTKRKPTPAQLEQREKFKLVSGFLRSMSPLLQMAFKSDKRQGRYLNSAMSYNMHHAITGKYPSLSLAFDRTLVMGGDLRTPDNPRVIGAQDGAIRWTWTNNAGMSRAKDTDRCVLIAHCPELKETKFSVGAKRSESEAQLNVKMFAGYKVETWIGFISANEKQVSDSIYTGSYVV